MNRLFFITLLPSLLCAAPGEDLHISSKDASYDGNILVLEGDVLLKHPLGNLYSEKAFLHKTDKTENIFSLIKLQNDVTISLESGSKLCCALADLNFLDRTGQLHAQEGGFVSYSGFFKNGVTPLAMQSKDLELHFVEASPAKYTIDKIVAKQAVCVTYDKDFLLTADEVVYEPNTSSPLSGLLKAYPKKEGPLASISCSQGVVDSPFIEIEGEEQVLRLKAPQGLLSSSLVDKEGSGKIAFSCGELKWDYPQETLILQKNVHIAEETFGSLSTTEQMIIQQEKGLIQSIFATGTSVLIRDRSTLTCFGELQVDGIKKEITALSPREKPLIYKDDQMLLKASQALLLYTPEFTLSSLTLKGDIQISSCNLSGPQRRALADKLSYHPDTETLILVAAPGKKVLFYDEEQGIKMSAQEVHVVKNQTTQKMDIQGIGNTVLSLSAEEDALLQKVFSQGVQP